MSTQADKKYMSLCLRLAGKAAGLTSPNPLVGAVVVKNGRIAGQGYHTRAGAAHAEVEALARAGKLAKGATMYVNFEPCCHFGKTPPCTESIISAGIARVVVAMQDPNPLVSGNGIRRLEEAGITVDRGLLYEEAAALNQVFTKYIVSKRPYVVIKASVSLDGKIATHTGESRWISNEKSRAYTQTLRLQYDAVMVGIGTVMADDPDLTYRGKRHRDRQPVRIIVDSTAKIPMQSRVLKETDRKRTIIAVTRYALASKLKKLTNTGAEVLLAEADGKRVNLDDLLGKLGSLGITSILVEGGGKLNASLLEARLVDKLVIFIAPKIIGGTDAVSFVGGKGADHLRDAFLCEGPRIRRFGDDILLETYPRGISGGGD
ncbi:MAG: bifunctional diaminohydroxyphosphoribosylaminopyrimidine deaminase/5-amino-6-(5-phosphoribosylamino)uracil reductase RibD [Spirochaetia bacterium]